MILVKILLLPKRPQENSLGFPTLYKVGNIANKGL